LKGLDEAGVLGGQQGCRLGDLEQRVHAGGAPGKAGPGGVGAVQGLVAGQAASYGE
jgi:hypothetical protein